MARIYPFRALRYDTSRVRMEDVVTQPYDKITPEMQQRYYEASPYNLVRIILGKHEPDDTEAAGVSARRRRGAQRVHPGGGVAARVAQGGGPGRGGGARALRLLADLHRAA